MLLAIDTATQLMSLALHDGQNLVAEQSWHTLNSHTIELAPTIQAMLARAGITVNDLTGLAVSIGPGSFTGLRIGVSLAKGLASVRSLPLVGMSTLDILAIGTPQVTGALVAVVRAGRGRIIAGRYQWRKGRWAHRGDPQLMDWQTLLASIDGTASLTGEIDAEGHATLAEAQARSVPITVLPAAQRLRRAGYLAQEAWALLAADKDGYPAAKVMPLYVKTKDVPA